jgi:hypothetical protein
VLHEQADLEVEVGPLVRRRGHAVLADQHEGREEDGLYRCDHRQDDERGIPGRDAGNPAEVGHDPDAEEGEVQVDEPHTAGEAGDRLRDPLLGGLSLPDYLQRFPEGEFAEIARDRITALSQAPPQTPQVVAPAVDAGTAVELNRPGTNAVERGLSARGWLRHPDGPAFDHAGRATSTAWPRPSHLSTRLSEIRRSSTRPRVDLAITCLGTGSQCIC